MFRKNKNSYEVTAYCTNGEYEAEYTFIEDWDSDETWGDIAERMFYDEFGVYPTKCRQVSYQKI